jgi:DNA-binding SARP family transcriptional activator/class 3 adenylate cyclase
VRLGILGALEVQADGTAVALGGTRQRALVAVLALHAGEVVSTDRLVDELWGERPPATAVHTVQVFVSRLRGALGEAGKRLVTQPPGYLLEAGGDEIDAACAKRLYETARTDLAAGDAAGAATQLREALALWRGPALADFTYEPFAQAAIAQLEELRLSCREELIEAQLALGRHAEVTSDLEALVREQPFRERPHGQLMLALYRCGRQADALEAYRNARKALVEELGVEPTKSLRELEEMILGQDEALDARPTQLAALRPEPPEPHAPPSPVPPSPVPPSPAPAARAPANDADAEPPAGAPVMLRRTATVLVARLSTRGHADPERARAQIAAGRREVERVVTHHGGACISGLAREVVAIFGFPRTKEDDALRAVRAAYDLRRELPEGLPAEADDIVLRVGLDTGEVVAESPEDVFGQPLDRAARLASVAAEHEILLSDATRHSAGSPVLSEPSSDAGAWRLTEIAMTGPALGRVTTTPMLGREHELNTASASFACAAREGKTHLLTVLGEAGIGKSRFAQALADRLGDEATVLAGRCLAYGEGVTYWPLREAITTVAGGESKPAIEELFAGVPDADMLAEVTAAYLGLTPGQATSEQIPWAIRRLLEQLASDRPLLLVIEDAHWAEPPLLDLIDYLVDWLTAPVLILCLARPELLDERPRWGGGHERVVSVVLVPLADEDARALLRHHMGDRRLSTEASAHVLATAEGNPLFVEQLLAIGDEDPGWALDGRLPATIQALLAARLDRLGPAERAFIERAAVIGREFWAAAVVALLPPEARASAPTHLRELVRRGLIHPHGSPLAGEEQLRFHHILIRDVAYHSTPKALRAELHERVAGWLAAFGDGYDEFVGYHLEQAFRYRIELGVADAETRSLAIRAGERLAAAGRRAEARSESASAIRLLGGAAEMFEAGGERRADVLLDLGSALRDAGELRRAERVLRDALDEANLGQAEVLGARALIELSALRALVDSSTRVQDTEAVAQRAMAVFERLGDDAGLARAYMEIAEARWKQCCFAAMEGVLEDAFRHARRSRRADQGRILRGLARAAVMGPRPVSDAIARCGMVLERTQDDIRSTAYAEAMLAVLKAMEGRPGEARELYDASHRRLQDIGLEVSASLQLMYRAFIELISEEPLDISGELTRACDLLIGIGERSRLSTIAALHARLLYVHGRYEESERRTRMSAQAAAADDVVSQVLWRGAAAKLLARNGRAREALEMVDRAHTLALQTDFLLIQGDARRDRSEVLALAGDEARARGDLEAAIALYERKGIRTSATAARERLRVLAADELRPQPLA